jgi:hypothetical protein
MKNNPSRRHKAQTRSPAHLDPADVSITHDGAWMTYAQLCELVGESRHTLNKWRARPDVQFPLARRKPNGKLLFHRPDVAAFLASLEVAA